MVNNRVVFNFSAGPAMLPPTVMQKAQAEFLNWHQLNVSVAEISHRNPVFVTLAHQIKQDMRDLLTVPNHYQILFLAGGARTQFSTLPMNLIHDYKQAAYVQTGHWSSLAAVDAKRYLTVKVVANSEYSHYTMIPSQNSWSDFSDCAYLHYVDNETIHGVEFPWIPEAKNIPLVCDMSSNILSRPIDVSRYGVIYACAQKNMGISGITLVIVRDDLLTRQQHPALPAVMNYALQAQCDSMYNTPPTFSWYVAGLVFQWIKEQGGVDVIAKRNQQKAALLYDYLDSQDFYHNAVDQLYRSRMNVVFHLPTPELDALFALKAAENNLVGLKGHKILGGIRASIYNAMPIEGVNALIDFMKVFVKTNG